MTTEPRDGAEGMDWQEVRKRLEAAQQALERGGELSETEELRVLRNRAEALSHPPQDPVDSNEMLELVSFMMADEQFAVSAATVREVTELASVTPLPGGPDFLLGVANLRGQVTPLIDLGIFFGAGRKPPPERFSVLVMGNDRSEFGIRVDRVDEVLMLRGDQILPPPGNISGVAREFLLGVTADAMMILDGEVLLRSERLYMDESD